MRIKLRAHTAALQLRAAQFPTTQHAARTQANMTVDEMNPYAFRQIRELPSNISERPINCLSLWIPLRVKFMDSFFDQPNGDLSNYIKKEFDDIGWMYLKELTKRPETWAPYKLAWMYLALEETLELCGCLDSKIKDQHEDTVISDHLQNIFDFYIKNYMLNVKSSYVPGLIDNPAFLEKQLQEELKRIFKNTLPGFWPFLLKELAKEWVLDPYLLSQ